MNYKQYCYEKNDGSYLLHFNNSKGLSISNVEKMFSTFGTVKSVYNRGQTHGLCFVICATFEDAKRCIDGFKNGKTIRILPHKLKTEAANMKPKTIKYRKNEEDSKESSTYNSKDENFESMKLFNSHKQRFASNSSISTVHSDTTPTTCKNMFDGSSIPALVPIDDTHRISRPSARVIPAETVIVANIHPGLSVHYILHLFEKYNPISASIIMMTPTSKIRYCHIYYKTLDEACATMEEFDAYCLHGKNLIVLTRQKLIEQATQL